MSEQFKPAEYASVSPYLIVEDAQALIDFLQTTFDATEGRRYDAPDGGILHVEVVIEDAAVMISDRGEDFPAYSSLVHVYVPDVDAAYERALEAGAESIEEPAEQEGDPDRRSLVEGPQGNTWIVSTQVE